MRSSLGGLWDASHHPRGFPTFVFALVQIVFNQIAKEFLPRARLRCSKKAHVRGLRLGNNPTHKVEGLKKKVTRYSKSQLNATRKPGTWTFESPCALRSSEKGKRANGWSNTFSERYFS